MIKGTAKLTLDGQERTLRFDINALDWLEDQTPPILIEDLAGLSLTEKTPREHRNLLVSFVTACLQTEALRTKEPITRSDVAGMINVRDLEAVTSAFVELLADKDAQESQTAENPPRAAKRRRG